MVGNGVRVVIVEDASRFARHLLTQEAGISLLVGLGVRVLTAAGDDLTDSDDEFRAAMRQIMGVFSQLEKTRLVKKLKSPRDRKRAHGKVEGRRSNVELHPEVVEEAKRLARASPVCDACRERRIAALCLYAEDSASHCVNWLCSCDAIFFWPALPPAEVPHASDQAVHRLRDRHRSPGQVVAPDSAIPTR